MMNNEMMRQLQARIMQMQEDLAKETVEASAGGGAVSVTISEIGMGPAQAKVHQVKTEPGNRLPFLVRKNGTRQHSGNAADKSATMAPQAIRLANERSRWIGASPVEIQ